MRAIHLLGLMLILPAGALGDPPADKPAAPASPAVATELPPIPKSSLSVNERAKAYLARAQAPFLSCTLVRRDDYVTESGPGRKPTKEPQTTLELSGKKYHVGSLTWPHEWWCDGHQSFMIEADTFRSYPVESADQQRALYVRNSLTELQLACLMTGSSPQGNIDFGIDSFSAVRSATLDGRAGVWLEGKRTVSVTLGTEKGKASPTAPEKVSIWLDDETGMVGQVDIDRTQTHRVVEAASPKPQPAPKPKPSPKKNRDDEFQPPVPEPLPTAALQTPKVVKDIVHIRVRDGKVGSQIPEHGFKPPIEGKQKLKAP